MIVSSMNQTAYNFNRCKLCGHTTAAPVYQLGDSWLYVCTRCDFHFLNVLDDVDRGAKTATLDENDRNYIESRLDESSHLHPLRHQLVAKYLDLSTVIALDIGAGLGQFQLLISEMGGQCRGIEPSSLRRQYAAEKFGIEMTKELVEQPFWQEGFSHHFDLITLWDVIEHVNFPRETLAAAVKLLKPGGFLSLETPSRDVAAYRLSISTCRLSGGKLSLFLPSFYSTARYGHKQIFTCRQITDLLNSVGLDIIELRHSYTKRLFAGDKIIIVARKQENPA